MLQLSITITLNGLDKIKPVIDIIKRHDIFRPVFIIQSPEYFEINFASDYEQWELQRELSQLYTH